MRKLSSILITVFITGMFVSGFIGLAGAIITLPSRGEYSRSNETSESIQTIERMYNITEASQNQSREGGDFQSDVLSNFIAGAWNAVIGIIEIPAFFGGVIADVTGLPGMPEWFAAGLYGIVGVVVLFAIYYFFTGRDS